MVDAEPAFKPARRRTLASAWVLVPLVLLAIGVAAAYRLGAFRSVAGVPPAGIAWFGEGYDPTTHALDRTFEAIPPGQSLVIVGHLIQPAEPGLAIQFSIDGDTFDREVIDVTSPSEFVMYDPSPAVFGIAGRYGVVFVDRFGQPLASGELTVTR